MITFQTLSRCFFIGMLRVGLAYAQCESIFYSNDGDLCYGMRNDSSTDNCVDIPEIGFVEAFIRNPVTEEFYVVAYNDSTQRPFYESGTEYPRFLYRFSASLEMGVPVVDTPVQIGDSYIASEELLGSLAFTCQGVPRLFALSSDFVSTQYLYEVDYLNDGNLTELLTWDITNFEFATGFGLFYHIENEKLYRIAGLPVTAYEIDPYDIGASAGEVVAYTADFANSGLILFASYFNEDIFSTSNSWISNIFTASVENASYADPNQFDDRIGFSTTYVHGIECSDAIARCFDTFSNAPSENPSLQPTYMPSEPSVMPSNVPSTVPTSMPSSPSYMPSSDPSSMPTEMPVEAMMTTEDEVMADTTMESDEPSDDSPEPTVADSASKNSISFIMVFVAAFGYLFY